MAHLLGQTHRGPPDRHPPADAGPWEPEVTLGQHARSSWGRIYASPAGWFPGLARSLRPVLVLIGPAAILATIIAATVGVCMVSCKRGRPFIEGAC